MSDAVVGYWRETVAQSFEENGLSATPEQIDAVAADVAVSHENYDLAFYHPSGPSPAARERDQLAAALEAERAKVQCDECNGKGEIVTIGPHHSSTSRCWKCNGEGRR